MKTGISIGIPKEKFMYFDYCTFMWGAMLRAVGNEVVSAKILDVDVKPGPTIGTMKTIITLLNNGTIHIRPSGNLAYVDAKGDIIKTIPIGDCLPVFADYKEEIPVYYSKMLKPGTYTAVCTINIGDGKLLQHKEDFTIADDFTIIEGHETR